MTLEFTGGDAAPHFPGGHILGHDSVCTNDGASSDPSPLRTDHDDGPCGQDRTVADGCFSNLARPNCTADRYPVIDRHIVADGHFRIDHYADAAVHNFDVFAKLHGGWNVTAVQVEELSDYASKPRRGPVRQKLGNDTHGASLGE